MTYVTSWIWTLPMRCSPVDNNSKAHQRGSRFSYNSCYWYHVMKPSLMAVFNGKANKLHFAPCRWWEANCRKVFPLSNLQTVSSMYLLSCPLCDRRKWSKNRKSEVHHSQEAVIVHQLWFWPLLIVIPSNFAQFGSAAITHRVKCDENRKGKQTEWRLTPKIGWSFFYDFPK